MQISLPNKQPKQLPKLAVDVMGADFGPQQIINGVKFALERYSHRIGKLFLVGDEAEINPILSSLSLKQHPIIEVVHASQTIAMHEKPLQTLKQKKDASMFRAIDLVKEGIAQSVLSCGNTGSLMAGSTLKLRTIPGVERPALASIIPTRNHHFVLIDVGANPNSNVKHLIHNAILGSYFAEAVLNEKKPRIGLLTIGTEEGKGNELVQQTHDYLKQLKELQLNYTGLIEGFDLFEDRVEVVVCNGFVGNILLKTCESLFLNLKEFLKQEFKRSYIRKLGATLASGVFKTMKKQFSPDNFSGAPLLGLNGWVFKSHGSSKAEAIASALNMNLNCLEVYNPQAISTAIEKVNAMLNLEENI